MATTGAAATTGTATKADEWRRGWALVMAASIGFSFYSVMAGSIGVFIEPLTKEFGWNRATTSLGMTIASVLMAILSPVVGMMIDRWGTRRLTLPGLVITTGVMMAFSLLNGSVTQWVVLWSIYAIVGVVVKSTVWTTAVASMFTAGRGLALGLTLSGTAAAQVVVPPLANALIAAVGWRGTFVWLSLGWGILAFVTSFLFLYDARDLQRRDRRLQVAVDPIATAKADDPALPGLSIKEAWRDGALWRIAISTLFMMILTIALVVHQFPILTEAGISRSNAALLASLGGIAGIVGKLATGWMLDRWRANWVGGITLGASSIAFLLLLDGIATPVLIVVAIVINGYASGTKLQICGYLTSRYAGMRHFGTIFGFMASIIALGSGIGPLVGGIVHDYYGTYGPFLIAGMIGCVFCGWLIAGLPTYPQWAEPAERTVAH